MKINPSIISCPGEAIDPLNVERPQSHVRIELDYTNNLGVDIVVLDRRGIEIIIPNRFNPKSKQQEFKILELFNLPEGVSLRFNENEQDADIVKHQQSFSDSLNLDTKAQRTTRKAIVSTVVKLSDLRGSNSCLFIKEYDIVLYIARPGYTVIHPATISKVINGLDVGRTKVSDFEFRIKINDPNNKIGDRFINISGLVYRIIPSRDSTQMEGVIVTASSTQTYGEFTNIPMSLAEFEAQVKTYKSFEEADTFGNLALFTKQQAETELELLKHNNTIVETTLKGDVAKHKAETERLAHELEVTGSSLKQKEMEHKKQLELLSNQLDREKHAFELQSLQRKSYYEDRSYDRKDSSELIKFLPLIVGAGLVLLFK